MAFKQRERWRKIFSDPAPVILAPTASWEGVGSAQASCLEPSPLYDSNAGLFKMWYTGGNLDALSQAIGYATSTDGFTWTKYVSNPVFGQGASGYASNAARANVVQVSANSYVMFYATVGSGIRYATSTDGISWTDHGTAFSSKPSWVTDTYSCFIQFDGSSTYHMFFDAGTGGTPAYSLGRATASSLTGAYTDAIGGAITSLQINSGDTTSGATILKIGSTYWMWYFATDGAVSGTTQPYMNDLYAATSSNLTSWTKYGQGIVIPRSEFKAGLSAPQDQLADPGILDAGIDNWVRMYYDIDQNTVLSPATKIRGIICMATFWGTPAKLVQD